MIAKVKIKMIFLCQAFNFIVAIIIIIINIAIVVVVVVFCLYKDASPLAKSKDSIFFFFFDCWRCSRRRFTDYSR